MSPLHSPERIMRVASATIADARSICMRVRETIATARNLRQVGLLRRAIAKRQRSR